MSTTEDRAWDAQLDRMSGGDYRCVTCDSGTCQPSGCEGGPGYVHTVFGWRPFTEALRISRTGSSVDWGDVWSYSRFGIEATPRVVFVDTETTGLNPDVHDLCEVAWAEVEGPIHEARVPHSLANFDETALEVNRYEERGLGDESTWFKDEVALVQIVSAALEGALICSSNVPHDKGFLKAWFYSFGMYEESEPWHHRPVEIGSYVAGAAKVAVPLSLRDTVGLVRSRGFTVPDPDHTAAGDVAAGRACYLAVLNG